MRRLSLVVVCAILTLVSCEQKSGFILGTESVECDLTLDQLDNTTWVQLDPIHGKGDIANAQARARFYTEDGKLKLKYTVKSLGDVYGYACEKEADELVCLQKIKAWHLEAMCRAYEAYEEGSCTAAKLEETAQTDLPDELVAKAVEAGRIESAKARGGDHWQYFAARNNNVGNKVQGRFYVKVDERRCRLRVTDMFLGVYNGKTFEDSNVVGTNPFVKSDEELLFEHCDDGRFLVDLDTAERPGKPEDIPPDRPHQLGEVVHYHYVGDVAVKAERDCTYSMDVWAQWRPVAKGVAVPVDGKKIDWHTTYVWEDGEGPALVNPFDPRGVLSLVRYKQCGDGEKEKINTICNAAAVVVPGAAPPPE
ncbi:MAG: hypothetical protein JRJ84_13070 [Deltaproteobacteria bacterium]|nr:hypothetical protein [Deltaproteobacteria bacterium]